MDLHWAEHRRSRIDLVLGLAATSSYLGGIFRCQLCGMWLPVLSSVDSISKKINKQLKMAHGTVL